ncbi:RNA polymerase sigma factor [Phenylobacterium soli]|uniref:RNA polymerase subunit sigma-24 n=1 Tax=Phenylobacterium soli TaxID=2170551 RepID=A0A328AJ98_9CAUL|nr:RNA polymerase sigma factor [Phenylobacterium soli]RAK54146.1 RNA polymerase subunit sigma-24 [Phenylobacterium soli]
MKPAGDRTDPELARLAADGDDRAFAELVRRHQEPLFRLLRRYLGSADEAQEAAHEAFVAAWGALRRYDPERPFGAWLRTIAINKARDRGRRIALRRRLFGESLQEQAAEPTWRDPAPLSDDALIERETLAILDQAIAQLPRSLKEPLLLTVIEGLSHKEAADVLGLSAKSIETRVYRARRRLAEQLSRQADNR